MNTFLMFQEIHPVPLRQQRGAVLAIALILLVVVTLLGLSSIKTVSQQEKMVSHSYDRSLAYQFAEAALREGEAQARIQAQTLNASFPTDQYIADGAACPANDPSINKCVNGLCATPDPDCTPRWANATFNGWTQYNGVAAITNASGNTLSITPEYFIEILRPTGSTCAPGALSFDQACNASYPDPDDHSKPPLNVFNPPLKCVPSCTLLGSPLYPTTLYQCCDFYRYRITARAALPGRAAVILQSVLSVQSNYDLN